ncbi:MAG: VanZ family protein [Lachnospiraceae bacterium]|nr:VanZ family protein [Lachnospiraceae bacterium]
MIVSFSAQTADESSGLSYEIAEKLAKFICFFKSDQTFADVVSLAGYFEHPIRKLAHFLEYGVLGALLSGTFLPVMKIIRSDQGKGRGMYRRDVLIVFILAAFDELHQYFVPGRYASVWDVLLDTFGSIVFLFFVYLIFDRKKT